MGTAFTPGIHIEFQPAVVQWIGYYFTFSLQTVITASEDVAWFTHQEVVKDADNVWQVPTQVGYSSYIMTVPLLFKFSFKPGRFLIGPYVGAYASLPLPDTAAYAAPLGVVLGAELGVRLGPGVLYLDVGYFADLDESQFMGATAEDNVAYRKTTINAALGYSFGIGKR
jgi:hypothetical protein